ncbi:MAG: CARDB domain-containing protein [Candidatus Omnitrophota bacterium]
MKYFTIQSFLYTIIVLIFAPMVFAQSRYGTDEVYDVAVQYVALVDLQGEVVDEPCTLEPYKLKVGIYNNGDVKVKEVPLSIKMSGREDHEGIIDEIETGEVGLYELEDVAFMSMGIKIIKVSVDPADRVRESDEENNSMVVKLRVTSERDYAVEYIQFISELPGRPVDKSAIGNRGTIRVRIANRGKIDHPDLPIRIEFDKEMIREETVSLAAGQSCNYDILDYVIIGEPGLHKLRATVDPYNDRPELDESNNCAEKEILLYN